MSTLNIRYSEEPVSMLAPCRVLLASGTWQVAPEHRPADWQEREKPKAVAPDKPTGYKEPEYHAPSQVVRAPHKPGAGRPKGFQPGHEKAGGKKTGTHRRVKITGPEIVAKLQTMKMSEIAAEQRCDVAYISQLLKASGANASRPCLACGLPTRRPLKAKYCAACAESTRKARACASSAKYERKQKEAAL